MEESLKDCIDYYIDGCVIYTPYSARTVEKLRSLGGTWDGSAGGWRFATPERAREIFEAEWGAGDIVDARVDSFNIDENEEYLGPYLLASRKGRDYRVRMPLGNALEEGSFPESGGSAKYPRVNSENAVYRLRCYRSFAEKARLEVLATVRAAAVPPEAATVDFWQAMQAAGISIEEALMSAPWEALEKAYLARKTREA